MRTTVLRCHDKIPHTRLDKALRKTQLARLEESGEKAEVGRGLRRRHAQRDSQPTAPHSIYLLGHTTEGPLHHLILYFTHLYISKLWTLELIHLYKKKMFRSLQENEETNGMSKDRKQTGTMKVT